jgi:hypothetical protein
MKIAATIAGMAIIATTSAKASDFDYGVGVKAGTLGAGAELRLTLTQTVNARLSLSSGSTNYETTIGIDDGNNVATVDVSLDLDFGANALLFDWHVFDGAFYVTVGMIKNTNSFNLEGALTDSSVMFNGHTYSVSQFIDPTVSGKINLGSSVQSYLGIGWGRKADDDPGLSVSLDLGFVKMDPSIDLKAPIVRADSGLDQAVIDQDINAAESAANKELSVLNVWPVVFVGINYAF